MSKILEVFSVWFDTKITELKKFLGLRESKVPFSDWTYWSGLKTFFIQIYVFERLSL